MVLFAKIQHFEKYFENVVVVVWYMLEAMAHDNDIYSML